MKYKKEVLGILKDKPLDYLSFISQEVHFGDENALKILLLSRISANPLFDLKLNVALIGDSDVGKTHAGTTIINMASFKYRYETTTVSPKVLFYEAKGLEETDTHEGIPPYSFYNKTILIDDVKGEDTEILKKIANTTNEPPSFSTVFGGRAHRVVFDHAPVVWTTRVNLIKDYQGQVDRRFCTVRIDTNTKDVMKHIFYNKANNISPEKSEEYKIATSVMDTIMNVKCLVKIPEFDYTVARTKSGLNFLMSLIRSHTKLNMAARDLDKKTVFPTVIATEEDITEGIALFNNRGV